MDPLIPALIGIGGIVLGSIFTFLFQNILYKKQAVLKIAEKVMDKRIEAYDKIYVVVQKLRVMTHIGVREHVDPNERIIRKPFILSSYDILSDFINEMTDIYSQYSQWYSIALIRAYNYYQDYISNCSRYYLDLGDDVEDFSISIKDDFIKLGVMFDEAIFQFYTKDCYRIGNSLDSGKWHKLPKEETEERMRNTKLYKLYINTEHNDA